MTTLVFHNALNYTFIDSRFSKKTSGCSRELIPQALSYHVQGVCACIKNTFDPKKNYHDATKTTAELSFSRKIVHNRDTRTGIRDCSKSKHRNQCKTRATIKIKSVLAHGVHSERTMCAIDK